MKCIYGIKALICIKTETSYTLLQTISVKENIPQPFLKTILTEMEKHGIIVLKKGKSGGYRLAKPAEQITLHLIVSTLDGSKISIPCINNLSHKCDDCPESDCTMRQVMIEVKTQMDSLLKSINLKSIIK